MSLLVVGSVAFDAIETPFGKTDKIVGGAGTYISLASSYFNTSPKLVSVVVSDGPGCGKMAVACCVVSLY